MTLDARKDRTALRLKLFDNGFVPLANKSKMCLIKGWSTIEVTPELIESREWARAKSFLDTGIRCGDVVALDWDIDDPDLLNDLLDEVVANNIVEESLFVRIGMPPRELWVYRTHDRIGKRTTGHFAPPGAAEDHKGFAVEILGAGCQFAAYGQRDATTAYHWPAEDLLEHEYMDLPVITLAQVDALKDYAAAFFERRELQRLSPAGGTDKGYTHTYDLTDDMVFEVQDIGLLSVAELIEYFEANSDEVLRCKVDTFRPTSGSWAGMISSPGGTLCVSDHGTYTSHFPVEMDMGASIGRLGELLAARFPEPSPELTPEVETPAGSMDPRGDLDENLRIALTRYAYVDFDDLIYDTHRYNKPGMTLQHFHNSLRQFYREEIGPQGGRKLVWLSELWMQHPERYNVATIGMRPDQPWPVYEEDKTKHINTYRPTLLSSAGGDAAPGFAFFERLLPKEDERTFFLRWLSYKLQHPETRGPAIVMVAHDTYGTGRGSLVNLMRSMFAPGLVNNISFDTLSGKTYQSQYNEWLADSLIVAVDEAQETVANLSRWSARNNAYEHLKEIVDPANHDVHINRKGSRNFSGKTYASIIVMTNHADSLVIPWNDRRFAILTNGDTPPPEYWEVFHAWRRAPENIGALVEALKAFDLADYSPFAPPPMTAAKIEMVEAGTSELDRAIAHVLTDLHDTLVVKEQILLKVEDYLADNNAEVPDDWHRAIERLFLRKTRRFEGSDRVRIDGKQRTVRMIGKVDANIVKDSKAVLDMVMSNGPLVRPIRTSAQIVAFRR